jgi:hypothetical protein
MPYVSQEIRHALDSGDEEPRTVGDLHYLIASLIDAYLGDHDHSYETFNGVIGVLACAQQEVYRRIVVPYEQHKLLINGDVFGVNRED